MAPSSDCAQCTRRGVIEFRGEAGWPHVCCQSHGVQEFQQCYVVILGWCDISREVIWMFDVMSDLYILYNNKIASVGKESVSSHCGNKTKNVLKNMGEEWEGKSIVQWRNIIYIRWLQLVPNTREQNFISWKQISQLVVLHLHSMEALKLYSMESVGNCTNISTKFCMLHKYQGSHTSLILHSHIRIDCIM